MSVTTYPNSKFSHKMNNSDEIKILDSTKFAKLEHYFSDKMTVCQFDQNKQRVDKQHLTLTKETIWTMDGNCVELTVACLSTYLCVMVIFEGIRFVYVSIYSLLIFILRINGSRQ